MEMREKDHANHTHTHTHTSAVVYIAEKPRTYSSS